MNTFNRLLRNSTLSFTTSVVTKAVNAVAFILIARASGVHLAGIFSLGTTYLVIVMASGLGLDELMIRQVARDRSTSAQYFGAFLGLRLLVACAAYGLMYLVVGRAMHYSPTTSVPILVLALSTIPDSLGSVGQALLNAHERFDVPLIAGVSSSLVKLGAGFGAVAVGGGLIGIGWAWVAGSSLGAAILLVSAARLAWPFVPRRWLERTFWIDNLRMALPFLIIGFLVTIEYQTDVIILSAVRNETEVGWYGAVTTIIFALTLIPQGYRAAVYPLMARYHKSDPPKLAHLYELSFFYLGALALPMAAGLALLSQPVVILLYKPGFSGAILPLQIISWFLIFNHLNVPNTRLMLVYDRQKLLSIFLAASMGLNILLNLWLDPTLGVVGAAAARVISAGGFLLISDYFVRRFLQPHNILRSLAKPILATALMAVAVWIVKDVNLWLAILVGIVVYAGALFILRGMTAEEQGWLVGIWRTRVKIKRQ